VGGAYIVIPAEQLDRLVDRWRRGENVDAIARSVGHSHAWLRPKLRRAVGDEEYRRVTHLRISAQRKRDLAYLNLRGRCGMKKHQRIGTMHYWMWRGRPRAMVKVTLARFRNSKAWRPLARVVWERERGPIPAGCVVAHVNGDTRDCRIGNLVCVSRGDLWRWTQARCAERYERARAKGRAKMRRFATHRTAAADAAARAVIEAARAGGKRIFPEEAA